MKNEGKNIYHKAYDCIDVEHHRHDNIKYFTK